jgi:hypothetical protein
MVKLRDGQESELAALMRSQARDAQTWRVRHKGRVSAVGAGVNAIPDPKRYDGIIPIEGRAWDWDGLTHPVCPVCEGLAGDQPCLRCDNGAWIRKLKGSVNPEVTGGPTSWEGTGTLKGGRGR